MEESDTKAQLQELLKDPLLKDVVEYLPIKNFESIGESTCISIPQLDASTILKLLSQTECMLQAELGSACRIKLEREEHEDQNIVIRLDATVKELKKIIQLKIENAHYRNIKQLRQETIKKREQVPENNSGRTKAVSNKTNLPRYTNINWKYIWKSKHLKLDNIKLLDDDKARMKDVGLRNGSIVRFAPRRKNIIKSDSNDNKSERWR